MDAASYPIVADFLREIYIPLRMLGKKSGSHKMYRYQVAAFSRLLGRPALLSDLSDTQIARALSLRVAEGAAPATVNDLRAVLCAVANFAWRRGLLDVPPEVPTLPMDEPETTAYSTEQVASILAACADRADWQCLVLLLWFTGLRIGAMLSLRCEDCRLPVVMIRARAQKQKRSQAFILPNDACQAVERIMPPPRELLFCIAPIKRLRATFGQILAAAGLPHGPRDKFARLRRSCAQACHAAGGNATLHLGHSSAAITVRHYLGPQPIDATYLPRPGNGHAADFSI